MNKKVVRNHYTILGLKSKLGFKHSDQIFGIPDEIPFQCPRIDSFIADIKLMQDHIERLQKLVHDNENNINEDHIGRECSILKEYQKTFIDSFEELRTACDNLRTRGNLWKRLANKLFDSLDNNKKFIDQNHYKKL